MLAFICTAVQSQQTKLREKLFYGAMRAHKRRIVAVRSNRFRVQFDGFHVAVRAGHAFQLAGIVLIVTMPYLFSPFYVILFSVLPANLFCRLADTADDSSRAEMITVLYKFRFHSVVKPIRHY